MPRMRQRGGPTLGQRRRLCRVGVEALEGRALLTTLNQALVEADYQSFLNRAADPAGLALWTSKLDGGAGARAVGLAIADSPEAKADNVDHAFLTYLGRPPTPGELAQNVTSLGLVTTDVLNARILGSAEFFADAGSSDAGFVAALYRDVLGRDADPAGLAAWDGALAAGASRTGVASAFLTSTEAARIEVTGDYEQVLGRAPDPAGLADWVASRDPRPSLTAQEVREGFITSPENRARILQANPPSVAPDPATAQAVSAQAYAAWKATYVTASGAGGFLRVQRTENGNDTVSEGIGYGMILAAYIGDRATFDGLWNYAKSHFDANGLMNWRIGANNQTTGENAATDADEDMAMALVEADRRWGGYSADAKSMIGKIMAHEIEPGTWSVSPGDAWGKTNVLNPSYFAPGYYQLFAGYSGNTNWNLVTNEAYAVLGAIGAKDNGTGLVPDWCDAAGNPVGGRGYNYSYDATRMPWRLATDYSWYGDPRATAQLGKLNDFFRRVGIANVKDGYTIQGSVTGQYHNAAFVAPAASASVASSDAAYRSACWQAAVAAPGGNYYNDTLRVLSLLVMGGQMTRPT